MNMHEPVKAIKRQNSDVIDAAERAFALRCRAGGLLAQEVEQSLRVGVERLDLR
jgi:hypothetical protein